MAFHTFLGYKCYWEYRKYKDNFYKNRAKVRVDPNGEDETGLNGDNGLSMSTGDIPSGRNGRSNGRKGGVFNSGFSLDKYFGHRPTKSRSAILVNADTLDEPVDADEFHYPKAERLNRIATFVFFLALFVFNIIYWTIALIVYLG